MNPKLSILVILVALLAGAMSIFLCNRLMRKYPLQYLSSYYYFIIFTYVFGVYSIVGSRVIQYLLTDHQTPVETTRSAANFLLILGIPFLILAWYMFLRLTKELFRKQLSLIFTIIYFSVSLLLFSGYTALNLYEGSIGSISFHPGIKEIIYLFSGLHSMVMIFGILSMGISTRKIYDIRQRKAFRWFYSWYCIIFVFNVASLLLNIYHPISGLVFIVSFIGFHLIPVVFLAFYHHNHYIEGIDDVSFEEKLGVISLKYNISKREKEVVALICKGMTNQEISDSLFISVQTVKDHIHRIFLKTGVKNRVQLTNLFGK
jgi:DNA-binding CsgD family transcriptional regulator/MFS family permease